MQTTAIDAGHCHLNTGQRWNLSWNKVNLPVFKTMNFPTQIFAAFLWCHIEHSCRPQW